jgi:cytochrome c553
MKTLVLLILIFNSLLSKDIGKELFMQKCAGCHGKKAEKKALGVSKVIHGWNKVSLEDALRGYKEGTYGEHLKNVMKEQLKKLKKHDKQMIIEHVKSL